jgi:hypothetical protein
MLPLDQIHVSFYDNVRSRRPVTRALLEVMNLCLGDTYRDKIGHIRRYHASGEAAKAAAMKGRLPAFTPSGTFTGGHAAEQLVSHSGIVCLDYDHVPDARRDELVALAAGDEHTVAAMRSPTDGVKLFAYVAGADARNHARAYAIVARYYDSLLQSKHDPSCKDVSRMCYLTHDPKAYVATLYTAFEMEGDEEGTLVKREPRPPVPLSTCQLLFKYPLLPGQRNANLYRIACEAARDGWDQERLCRALWDELKGTDFTYDELEKTVSNGYKEVRQTGKKNMPRQGEQEKLTELTKLTKLRAMLSEQEENEEEAYWEGEELRKQTPYFPDSVYENMPLLLEEAIPEGCTRRQRDVALLAQLAALGAALPDTWGLYNRRLYSPHAYVFIVAPAGSGKSIAETGRLLLEELQERVATRSAMALSAYEDAMQLWKERGGYRPKNAGKKKDDGDDDTDGDSQTTRQPERPPYRTLLIPGNTSGARLYLQLRDNADMGGIVFDTEAETLANANGMDYGHFDDVLRKCAEHERIEYSYKVAGMEPIVVRHPRLALLLTGTAPQFGPLLDNSENGLASRVLFYTFREDPRWNDVGEGGSSLEDQYAALATKVARVHDFCAANPALFHFTQEQWNTLNAVFRQKLAKVALEQNDSLQAITKRYARSVMRLGMTLTRARQAERGEIVSDIYCDDADFRRAIDIVLCCYEHARLLMSTVPTDTTRRIKDINIVYQFIDDLPERFTTAEALKAGDIYGYGERKVMRILKNANGLIISKIGYGTYEKIK